MLYNPCKLTSRALLTTTHSAGARPVLMGIFLDVVPIMTIDVMWAWWCDILL